MDFLGDIVDAPHRARSPFLSIGRGKVAVNDRSLVVVDADGVIEIPVAMVSAIFLEPGVSITHEAVKLAAENDTLLLWTGEAGIRLYSAGMPGGKSAGRIVSQVKLHLDDKERLQAAQRLYRLMFGVDFPATRSIEKLRGMEGARVKRLYAEIASQYGVQWEGREAAAEELRESMGFATSCLYGLAEAVILVCGYAPSIGVVHSGDQRSLVFDLADTVKFKTVIPVAFQVFAESNKDIGARVRRRCRDVFRQQRLAETLFANLYEIMGEYAADVASS